MNVNVLVGKTLSTIERTANVNGSNFPDSLTFITTEGERYCMRHFQDCCECVYIEDICGDLEDLINTPILSAEESSSDASENEKYSESATWTFYRFSTAKGPVVIRWVGESNGYYSESVDFEREKS